MVLWSFVELSFKVPYTQSSRVSPCKKIVTSKFSCLHFSNPTHKTETGTANSWETPNQTTWTDDFQKHWAAVRSYLLHSFLQVHNDAAHFTSHRELFKSKEPKPFPELNWHVFTFFHLILLCRSQTDHCWRWSSAPIFPFEKERTTQHWYDELGVLVTLSWMRLLSLGAGCGGAGLGFMTQLMMNHNWKPRFHGTLVNYSLRPRAPYSHYLGKYRCNWVPETISSSGQCVIYTVKLDERRWKHASLTQEMVLAPYIWTVGGGL